MRTCRFLMISDEAPNRRIDKILENVKQTVLRKQCWHMYLRSRIVVSSSIAFVDKMHATPNQGDEACTQLHILLLYFVFHRTHTNDRTGYRIFDQSY
jgi:hypothetical protein